MLVSFVSKDICWREYEPFTVLYDLRNRQILTLENVAVDIWRRIASEARCEFDEIVQYVAKEYECDEVDVTDDIEAFIEELYRSGIVLLDGKCHEPETGLDSPRNNQDDIEGEIIRSLEPFDQLYSATIELTYACNESCVHCYAHFPGAMQGHKQIGIEAYKKAIDDLRDMGCLHLAFTGGDPFMHPDFPEVFFYARQRGFVCDVYTNCLFLYENAELLASMIDAKPRAFFVSLYGSQARIHDSVTATPGSFDITISVIQKMKELGASVVANIMLLSINYFDLSNIIELAQKLNIEYRVNMSLIMRNDGNDGPMDYFVNDRLAIKEAVSIIRDKLFSIDMPVTEYDRTEYICGAGITTASIDPMGKIHPCLSIKRALGDIGSGTVQQAWNSPERQRFMNSLKWSNTKECVDCPSSQFCPHCPGMSQAESGDISSCNTCDKIISECIMELEKGTISKRPNNTHKRIPNESTRVVPIIK